VHSERSAIVVTSHPGQLTCAELARRAAADERPRKDYVELACRLDADVIDGHWMRERAAGPARLAVRLAGMPAGQVLEAFLRRGRYRHILAWADRIGLPLALLFKVARARRDLVMISVWLSRGPKAFLVRRLGVHTHLRAIVGRAAQAEIAATRLRVPADKLFVEPRPVDERFWRPLEATPRDVVAAAGWEARDYGALVDAMRGLDTGTELAIGSIAMPEMAGPAGDVASRIDGLLGPEAPGNVRAAERRPDELRRLYAESRFVVVPLHDVEFDAGVTAVTEAMAMGKAVVASRTAGLDGAFEDGVQGVFVPPGDTRALRAAITTLLADPARAERMGRAGRALVERDHRLDPCLDRLAAIVRGEA
jgi:glycosyltransferase involved in cell wall biosynthesis